MPQLQQDLELTASLPSLLPLHNLLYLPPLTPHPPPCWTPSLSPSLSPPPRDSFPTPSPQYVHVTDTHWSPLQQELEASRKRAFSLPACTLQLPGSAALSCPQPCDPSFMLASLPGPQPLALLPEGPPEQASAACDPFGSSLGFPALGQAVCSGMDLGLDAGLPKELSAPFDDWGDILQHDFPL